MERIKVMIVDDDHLILNDMQCLIDWQTLGLEVAAVAYNGRHAIDRYEKCKPQIIFTDIKMPLMDGIEMMKAIRKTDKSVIFVVMSAHSEFRYVKEAIGLGAYSYILKDEINQDSLLELVQSLKEAVCQQGKTAYMSILNAVHTYFKEAHNKPAETLSDLERFFGQYHDCGVSDWGVRSLFGSLGNVVENVYRENGKTDLLIRRKIETKEELSGWISEQILMVHRWRMEEQKGVSQFISKSMLFIENNYSDRDLSIQKIAEWLKMSESWLSVCFKKEVGCTINEYIKKARICKAKELLALGEYKVYEVADLVGFSSSRYFSTVFCQETNQTPQQYRGESGK